MLLVRESPRHNLKLLWWLRNLAIAGQSATVAFCFHVLGLPLPLAPLFVIVAVLFVINILTHFRLKSPAPVTPGEFFLQLLIDMLGLAGLLYFAGGATNPFTSLFILQVVIAAVALPAVYCWLSAGIAILLYTALMVYKNDMPVLSHQHAGDFFSLHVQGMWVNFLMLSLLIAWFAYRMAASLRRQDRLLAEAQQLAVLGTFATQAAHDLGTPLSTMALLAETLREEAFSDAQRQRAQTLTQQIERCKQGISRIAASAGVMRAESGRPMPLDAYLISIRDHFLQARPDVALGFTASGHPPAPAIAVPMGFEQAITNLLANAADACGTVAFHAQWTAHALTVTITDNGAGITDAVLASLGAPGMTSKPNGLGMGLYLTKTVVARLGGTLEAERLKHGGTLMRVALPLARLLA